MRRAVAPTTTLSIPDGGSIIIDEKPVSAKWLAFDNVVHQQNMWQRSVYARDHQNRPSKIRSNNKTLSLLKWLLMSFFVYNLFHVGILLGIRLGPKGNMLEGGKYDNSDIVRRRGSSHHRRTKYDGQYKNYPEGTPPKDWKTMGFYDIRHYFDCKGYAHDDKKPLTTLSVYNDMQQKYKEIVIEHPSWDQDPIPPTEGYTLHTDKAGPSPFYADHGEHGRGLFASRDIQMGELVHDGTHSDMVFPTGQHWRAYILSLERRMACDLIDWSWTQKTEKDGEYQIFSTPNISGLFNGGNGDQINANPPTQYSKKFYAMRDIQRGEELITDYHVYPTDWKAVGLG